MANRKIGQLLKSSGQHLLAILFCCTLIFSANKSIFGQDTLSSILIKNGTIITITNGVKQNTDVLIINDKITNIGDSLVAPEGSTIIDATGQYVMPGIIDAHSHIGIDVINERTNPITPEVNVGDVIDPSDINLYHALAGGVTTIHAMHGSANVIGGQCETLKLRYGTLDPEELKMKGAPRTIKFALGENPMRIHGSSGRIQPASRMGIEQIIRKSFADAIVYKQKWQDYHQNPLGKAPDYSLRMETLGEILSGQLLIHCHSYRADEILMLLDVLKEYGVDKIVFQHVNEGFKVAPELAEFGAMASVFSDWWAYKFEVYYSTAFNAAILTRNGVVTSINSDDPELIRHLYHEAAKTQRYGNLSDNEALSLITINPAIQLGIEDRVGSIERGKDADLVIFNEHPLSIYAVPQKTIVDGSVKFDVENDASDMRLLVNPEEIIESSFFESMEMEGCMQDEDVFDHLFYGSNLND